MKTSPFRSRVFVGSLLVGALMAAACTVKEVDDETPAGGGGSLSSAGTGGTGGTTAGTGGTAAGTGGIAGTAGTGGTGGTAGAAGTAGSAGAGGGAPAARGLVRFAHLAADVGLIDVCLRLPGEQWTDYSPIFRGENAANQWGFPAISRTIAFDVGTYEVRIIDATAADCGTAKAGVVDQNATIAADRIHTVALMGRASALTIKTFTTPQIDPANLTLHVINGLTNQEPSTELAFIDNASPANTSSLATGLKGFTDKTIVTADPAGPVKIAAIVDDGLPAVTVIASVPDAANLDPTKGFYGTDEILPGDRFEVILVGTKAGETDPQLVPEAIVCGVTPDGREVVEDPATGAVVDGPIFSAYCTYGSQTK